jgi:hypothetical protein
MLKDFRKLLDHVAIAVGFGEHARTPAGEVVKDGTGESKRSTRARRYRSIPWGRELGHGGDSLVKRVYGHLGAVRHRAEVVEYRWEQHQERLADRLAAFTCAR